MQAPPLTETKLKQIPEPNTKFTRVFNTNGLKRYKHLISSFTFWETPDSLLLGQGAGAQSNTALPVFTRDSCCLPAFRRFHCGLRMNRRAPGPSLLTYEGLEKTFLTSIFYPQDLQPRLEMWHSRKMCVDFRGTEPHAAQSAQGAWARTWPEPPCLWRTFSDIWQVICQSKELQTIIA